MPPGQKLKFIIKKYTAKSESFELEWEDIVPPGIYLQRFSGHHVRKNRLKRWTRERIVESVNCKGRSGSGADVVPAMTCPIT